MSLDPLNTMKKPPDFRFCLAKLAADQFREKTENERLSAGLRWASDALLRGYLEDIFKAF
jgi:hypothetical protein